MMAINHTSRKSLAHQLEGPWMNPEVLAKLPQLQRDFSQEQVPVNENAAQTSGTNENARSSQMVHKSQPKSELRPPEHIARPVDQSAFNAAWMREQREAAFKQADAAQARAAQAQNQSQDAPDDRSGLQGSDHTPKL